MPVIDVAADRPGIDFDCRLPAANVDPEPGSVRADRSHQPDVKLILVNPCSLVEFR